MKIPKNVYDKINKVVREAIDGGIENIRSEGDVDVISNPDHNDPKFIDLGSLSW